MSNLHDIIRFTEGGSKAFVINEHGDITFVVIGADEYRKLRGEPAEPVVRIEDVEKVNREITRAQLQELRGSVTADEDDGQEIRRQDLRSEVIDESFNLNRFRGDEPEAIQTQFDDI
jgi:hypothetical protein